MFKRSASRRRWRGPERAATARSGVPACHFASTQILLSETAIKIDK
jgi:hypothetical protein